MASGVVMLKAYLRGPDLSRVGEIRGWSSLTIKLVWNGVGSWTLEGPASGLIERLGQPGYGLIVVDPRGVPLLSPDGVVIAGDVEDNGPRVWSADNAEEAFPGKLTLVGGDDLAVVADELAFPDPLNAVPNQTADYDKRTGPAETVIKGYVSANVGTTRAAARGDSSAPTVRTVTVAADQGRGSTVSYSARFDPLLDVIRTCATASTPKLGVRVQYTASGLLFDIYTPQDRSSYIRFSRSRRNLRGYSVQRSMPTVTHVVVGGGGEGVNRLFVERKDSSAAAEWFRVVRTFVDQRQTEDTAELEAAGDEELQRGRRSGVLSATAVDTPRMRFGEHFCLGDLVTVELENGISITDRVTAAIIRVTEEGMTPTEIQIGAEDVDTQLPESYARADEALRKLMELARRY